MVAKITTGKSMRGALSYNENKVKEHKAACIAAVNFAKDAGELNFHEKLQRFTNLTRWKPKVRTNTLHVSLNFHPSERLSQETLGQIATAYMTRIGFQDQPYLIYQHFDAAHPHIHIVSTNVRKNGTRIDLHNIGRLRSEPARQSIEKEFQLLSAKGSIAKSSPVQSIPTYGRQETRRSIINFVTLVARTYRYTSLPEFNAALSQFNITAYRGDEKSLMFQKEGLLYSFTDDKGKMIGVPVKASSIHSKPTLQYLKRQFKLNEALRSPGRVDLMKRVTTALHGRPSLAQFRNRLLKENTFLVLRLSVTGQVFGATFVDNKARNVFNGSDLSKDLGAKGLFEKLSNDTVSVAPKIAVPAKSEPGAGPEREPVDQTIIPEVLNDLLSVQQEFESIVLYKRKRKKRRSRKNR